MNLTFSTTQSAVYLAVRHVFPEVPISAGAFDPIVICNASVGCFDAKNPRPFSGSAAEVSQRIAEAAFAALVDLVPERVTGSPAGTRGNFALGGYGPN